MMFKDFCPLCGSRFKGETPEEIMGKIDDHIKTGYCKEHFRPFDIALHDTGGGWDSNLYEPKLKEIR
jgi:hypothetical protein